MIVQCISHGSLDRYYDHSSAPPQLLVLGSCPGNLQIGLDLGTVEQIVRDRYLILVDHENGGTVIGRVVKSLETTSSVS